jgi:hypothetical protein
LNRKFFLDTQINELQKQSRPSGDAIQASIDEMLAPQKAELAVVDESRGQMQRLGAETAVKKKMTQKHLALQTQINKRKGIFLHSSCTVSRKIMLRFSGNQGI